MALRGEAQADEKAQPAKDLRRMSAFRRLAIQTLGVSCMFEMLLELEQWYTGK